MLTSMESMMTTVELNSSRLSQEMDSQPLAATLLLFWIKESRLSNMLTMKMGLFRALRSAELSMSLSTGPSRRFMRLRMILLNAQQK